MLMGLVRHITPSLRSTSAVARRPDSQLGQGGVSVKLRRGRQGRVAKAAAER
jgi:hypothetical protein